ncbi:hypothetical protein BX616_007289 [Lobosporangium transversale]|uniref:Ubiquitin-related domain-containing protein n=1 Tax=Lobosporangium transversale TaxID=64571 RepID=A0A1Y2GC59_9FUNG|nr:ubiquitin-related domain-containing protein [Lobosporangium transversale]KAF9914929.1 hypothetical protein BX616_007289 [Lobosporangium transversale]ORZ05726.1 ubiquitin-related domain-containing protein [Lobosporangium transversale]|eukprot:XP_021877213.1 ubiquitin-related domain-containing protein [Lobosporangium transversale]
MSSAEESLFISQVLAVYAGQSTKFPADYIPPGLAPNWTSKRATFERPAKPVKAGAPEGDIQVTIKSLKSGQWTVSVPAQGTIADLKQAFQAKSGIEVAAQRLVLKGKALVDSKSLEDYGLMTGSVVHLFSKAGGTSAAAAEGTSVTADAATAPTSLSSSATAVAATQESENAGTPTQASTTKKPLLTSYRGLSEKGTAIAKEAEFWYWLNSQLRDKLGSKEDAALMTKGFLGQYRDLVGNAATKDIEKEIVKK